MTMIAVGVSGMLLTKLAVQNTQLYEKNPVTGNSSLHAYSSSLECLWFIYIPQTMHSRNHILFGRCVENRCAALD